jgi:hypothetical protein
MKKIPIGYGDIEEKNDVNLQKLDKAFTKELKRTKAKKFFKATIFQKNCSDNHYLPSNAIFSLPIEFVNLLFNYAKREKLKTNNEALEHFLTHQINARSILKFVDQRGENSDNQCRRLHNAVIYQMKKIFPKEKNYKKRTRQIIVEKSEALDRLVQEAIREGKKMYKERAIKETTPTPPNRNNRAA